MIHSAEGSIPAPADHADRLAEALRLALVIADEAAASDIESFGRPLTERWYDIAPFEGQEPYHASALIRAVRYLTLRDQLEVDPNVVQYVRVRTE